MRRRTEAPQDTDAATLLRLQTAMYSADAESYAAAWAPVLQPMGEWLLAELPLRAARRVLDVGAGTGVLHASLRAAAPQALLVGVDVAEGMLRVARRTSPAALAVGAAERIPVAAGACDVAVATFSLHHMAEPVSVLREVRRVVRPGGSVGVATWGVYEECEALEAWVEELDAAGAAPDEQIAIANHELLDDADKLRAALDAAGYAESRVFAQRHRCDWSVEMFERYVTGLGRLKRRFLSLPTARRDRFLADAHARVAAMSDDERAYRAEVVYGIAVAPAGR